VYIAYDRDDAGEKAAAKHAEELMAMGIECFRGAVSEGPGRERIRLDDTARGQGAGHSVDECGVVGQRQAANYSVGEPDAGDAAARGEGAKARADEKAGDVRSRRTPHSQRKIAIETPTSSTLAERALSLAANPETVRHEEVPPRSMPLAAPAEPQIKIDNGEISATFGLRTYRVLNLAKCTSPGKMHVNLKVSGPNARGEWESRGEARTRAHRSDSSGRRTSSSIPTPRRLELVGSRRR
jgi:hypothetical protein